MTMQTPAPIEAPPAVEGRAARPRRSSPPALRLAPEVVLRRYASLANLSTADMALLNSLAEGQSSIAAGQELECEGEPSRTPRLILSGWACRFRMLADGRRMILTFLVPGDAVSSRRCAPALASTAALTPCRLADARPLWRAIAASDPAHAQLAQAQHILDVLDDCYLLDHIVRLGRQTAVERMCHLMLELRWRLRAVGLAHACEFALPLTQEAIGDAVGLSVVHVNRTLQDMRRRGLIELRQGRIALLQPDHMAEIAEFCPPFSVRAGLGSLVAASQRG
ncbi:MAG: Crp/Fnr family transcriptional regulator [Vitreimonas sp.]